MQDPLNRGEAAAEILTASNVVGRWWARDFKPGQTPDDLTFTQFAILSLAEQMPGINLSQLAEHLDVSVPVVVRAVDALERKSLVLRHRPSMKQRDVTLAPTAEGKETRAIVEQMRYDRLCDLLEKLSDAEVAALVLGFNGLMRAVSPAENVDPT